MSESRHHLLHYEYVEGMAERRTPHREAHLAHIRAAREAGQVVQSGPLGDPPDGGAIVFRDTEPADIERFVHADPYMQAGLITSWRIRSWLLS